MKSAGNGQPQNCVNNIMSITRGEVPYERAMGIDGSLYDRPLTEVKDIVLVDAEDQIETYETRVEINSVDTIVSEDKKSLIIKPDVTVME